MFECIESLNCFLCNFVNSMGVFNVKFSAKILYRHEKIVVVVLEHRKQHKSQKLVNGYGN